MTHTSKRRVCVWGGEERGVSNYSHGKRSLVDCIWSGGSTYRRPCLPLFSSSIDVPLFPASFHLFCWDSVDSNAAPSCWCSFLTVLYSQSGKADCLKLSVIANSNFVLLLSSVKCAKIESTCRIGISLISIRQLVVALLLSGVIMEIEKLIEC